MVVPLLKQQWDYGFGEQESLMVSGDQVGSSACSKT